MPLPILNWEDKLDYWRQLHAVIQTETAVAEFRPMLGMLAPMGIEQGKPFNPDAHTQGILEEAARTALAEMRVVFYASRNPAHIAWKDRKWEWFPLRLISARRGTLVLRRSSTSSPATVISGSATAFRQQSANRQSARVRFTG